MLQRKHPAHLFFVAAVMFSESEVYWLLCSMSVLDLEAGFDVILVYDLIPVGQGCKNRKLIFILCVAKPHSSVITVQDLI